MLENKVHFRHILLYYFKKGKQAAEAHRKICGVYGDDALTEHAQKWFAKFRSGDTSLEDGPHSGRPTEIDSNDIKMPHKLNEENLANRMSICNSLLKRHESDPFLKRMTDDEKWIIYDIVRKRSWRTAGKSPNAIPKAYIQRRFCYPYGGIIVMRFYELFPQGKTIDSKVYCTQLTKLNQA
ncbi:PREDICTED: histone-lysine N-methyltransferase SETMAR-like isoform X1 [Acromyrmex echinatior]|uniref:histone-lysine N-methyltransferase SETMAR-like isoform X1 n=1 Tax=Acromyrmex echinatior TaxID=103372 RepID=UPI000580E1EE|nr:PREDICTED: histone-lysine N-methyltransferase SETMAR-like isoform X1 [Acromyrmex echinatior]